MSDEYRLGDFLREVSNWDWETFCLAENDTKYSSNQAMIFGLIRACAMEKLDAIKLALGRLDGKLKTPIRIEMPKVYFLYPNAKLPEGGFSDKMIEIAHGRHDIFVDDATSSVEVIPPTPDIEPEEEPDIATLTLRQTLTKMADHPRQVPEAIITYATATQQWLKGNGEEPIEKPMVKSVVAAHLLKLAQERNIDAMSEVFDQIDGKLVETIQVLGEDIYITDYSLTAPDGAYLNSDGVLQLEATQAQDVWTQKLTGKLNG
jgi:hypothetical protein